MDDPTLPTTPPPPSASEAATATAATTATTTTAAVAAANHPSEATLKTSFTAVAVAAAEVAASKRKHKNRFKMWKSITRIDKEKAEEEEAIPSPPSSASIAVGDEEGTISVVLDSDIPNSPPNMPPTAFVVSNSSTAEEVIQLVLDKYELTEKAKHLRLVIKAGHPDEISLLGLQGVGSLSQATMAGLRHLISINEIVIASRLPLSQDDLPLSVKRRLHNVTPDPVFVVTFVENRTSSIDGKNAEALAQDISYAVESQNKPRKSSRIRSHTFAHGLSPFKIGGKSSDQDTKAAEYGKAEEPVRLPSTSLVRIVFDGPAGVGHIEDVHFKLTAGTSAKSVIQSVFKKFDVDLKASNYMLIFVNNDVEFPMKPTEYPLLMLQSSTKNANAYFCIQPAKKLGVANDLSTLSISSQAMANEDDAKGSDETTHQIRMALDWNRTDQKMIAVTATDTFQTLLPRALAKFFLRDQMSFYSIVFHWNNQEHKVDVNDSVLKVKEEHQNSSSNPVEPVFVIRDDRIQVALPLAVPVSKAESKEPSAKRARGKSLTLKIPFGKSISAERERTSSASNVSASPRESERNGLGALGESPRQSATSEASSTPRSTTPRSPGKATTYLSQITISSPDGDITERYVRVKPEDTVQDLILDITRRHSLDNPHRYVLYLTSGGSERALEGSEHPFSIREKLVEQGEQFSLCLRKPEPPASSASGGVLAGPSGGVPPETEDIAYGFVYLSIHSEDGEINEPRCKISNRDTAKSLIDRTLSRHDLNGNSGTYSLTVQEGDLQRTVELAEYPLLLSNHLLETHPNVVFHLAPSNRTTKFEPVKVPPRHSSPKPSPVVAPGLYNFEQIAQSERDSVGSRMTGVISVKFVNDGEDAEVAEQKQMTVSEADTCRTIIQKVIEAIDPKLKWQHYSMLLSENDERQLLKYIDSPLILKQNRLDQEKAEPTFLIVYSKGKTDEATLKTEGRKGASKESKSRFRARTISFKGFGLSSEKKHAKTEISSPSSSSGPYSEEVEILIEGEDGASKSVTTVELTAVDSALVVLKKVMTKVNLSEKAQTYGLYLSEEGQARKIKIAECPLVLLQKSREKNSEAAVQLVLKIEKKATTSHGKPLKFKFW